MPVTLQEAQRRALPFLDTLGQARPGEQRLNTLEAMIVLYAEEFINAANKNLDKDGSNSSGTLSASMEFKITRFGLDYNLKLLVADYYDYLNKGVRGIGSKNKNNTSPYKFKSKFASKAMLKSLKAWIVKNSISARFEDQRQNLSALQQKRASLRKAKTEAQKVNSLAYAIASSIKQKGLNATGFWDKAFDSTFKDFDIQMSKALGVDISIDLRNIVQRVKQ